ncbi:MAG: tetratricopeptide repeat protein [Acidobacteriota bacterium]|nr:tetratricopeptide repeat protein [Acidobacteriota bacterium]
MFKTLLIFILAFTVNVAAQQNRSVEINTGPKAAVWLDGVFRGVADDAGKLIVKPVSRGAHSVRIRAFGFKEVNLNLSAAQTSLKAPLVKTFDRAEIAFQNAEKILAGDKYKAIEFYREAIRISPRYDAAHLGLARALADAEDNDSALKAVAAGRASRPVFPELSAVEGRIYRGEGEIDKAIASFERAIREGKGFQPEAHTGLALIFKDEAEAAAASTDFDLEKLYYEEAAKSFEIAIDQLSATEPVVYLLLGQIYEKTNEKKKAIAVYERFLRDMPDNEERTAVESFIVQLRKPSEI